MSRKFGKVWDYPTQRKFRRVTAIADDGNIAKGESYEIARKFHRNGEVWYELKGAGEHKGDIFVVTFSTLGEAAVKGGGSTKLSRKFAERYVELSEDSDKDKTLANEFNVHEFTVKRLSHEARQMWLEYGDNFIERVVEEEKLRVEIHEILQNILSDSAAIASQKKYRTILTEKEETDQQYRALAQRFGNVLHKYLSKEPKLTQDKNGNMVLAGSDVHPKLGEIIFFFTPSKGATKASYGHLKSNPEISAIIMPLLKGPGDQQFLADRFRAHKRIFNHEFIHYIDEKRTGHKTGSVKKLKDKGEEAYYNSPEEYNAYYQEGTGELLKLANGINQSFATTKMKAKMFPPDVKKFLKKDRVKRHWGNDFIDKMSPKMRRHFVKRVTDLYPKIINTVYNKKERATLKKHLDKKKADQKFYCERKRHMHGPRPTIGPPKLGRADAKMG